VLRPARLGLELTMATHEPGTEIAGYRIESFIGRGGMAVVYRAEDMRLGRKVALKLLTPQLADSEQFRQRFIRESRLAASLDHPNIVPIYEAGEADGQLFIAMRYVIGADLKAVLNEMGGQLPLERTLRLFSQIGNALDSAHRAGLVHRDVKPANILVASDEPPRSARGDHVYLTDFGLTKRTTELSGGLTGTGHFLGTVDYVSPEQIQGRPVGSGTDIYALGCVLYECLTGQLPFRRDDDAALLWAHLVETPAPISGIRPEVPAAVDGVVTRAMAKDPADRYGSCEELLQDLEAALDGQESPSPAGQSTGTSGLTGPVQGSVGYSLAIDLGTSFIAAAVADDRGLEMFGLGDGSLVAPAAVFIRDDRGLVTGDAAARRAISNPDRVARDIKRNLGNPTPLMLGGAPYAVSDLLGALLEDVLVRATDRQGAKPDVVALTHPANWGPFRKGLFEDVARAAGLTDPLYTTEPEAAAAHYASTRPLNEGDVLAVYDLGGGTFDATVLRRMEHGFEILGTPEGIERLGGADFDEAIFAHVNYLAGGLLAELDLSDPKTGVALARLRQDCTLAKEALSVDIEATVPVFLPNRHFDVTITRTELEGMIRAPIESTIGTLDRVLRAAQVDSSTLAAVLLVGGSSRIPLVAQMVSEAFGRPTVVGAHPKHAVALGAALLAEARRRGVPAVHVDSADAQRTSTGSVITERRPAEVVSRETSRYTPGDSVYGTGPARPSVPTPSVATPSGASRAPAAAAISSAASRSVLTEPVGRGPVTGDVVPPGHVPSPRAGEPSGAAPPTSPPPVGAEPAGAPAGSGPAAPWWQRYLALLVGLVLLVVAAGVAVYLGTRPDGPSGGGQTATPPTASPSPPPPPATAVPIPPIGATIEAGDTPGYVAAAPNGTQLYIANRGAGVVTVVDTAVNKITGTITIDAGPPQFIAFSRDGTRAYVSVWDKAASEGGTIADVVVLDTTSNTVVQTIPVDTRPFLSAVSPNGELLYVPNHDTDSVSVIDTATNELVTNIQVAPNPHWVAFTQDGTKAYTANHDSNLVSAIDPATNTVTAEIPTPTSPHSIAVHPTQPLLIVACFDADAAAVIDTNTDQVITTVPVGPDPQFAAWSADGRFAYIVNNDDNTVSVVDGTSFTVVGTVFTGNSPTSMAQSPDGSLGYVSNLEDGTLTELKLAG
jgi:YVTN family beta-propeller protein